MAEHHANSSSFKERQQKEEEQRHLRHQLISFAMMIVLTILAFVAVAYGGASAKFVPIFILLLAVIQAGFQMFYFMHLKDKGHNFPVGFIASGVVVAILTVASLMTLIWEPH